MCSRLQPYVLQGDARTPVVAMARGGQELRVVFNGQRHCYIVRDALATEPSWLLEVRSSRYTYYGYTYYGYTHA